MMQALLEKYVKLSHRKQMPKTYDDIKVNFQIDCRTDAGFWFNLQLGLRSQEIVSEFQTNCLTMFYVIDSHSDR